MYDTILVPTDGSEGTARTVEHARSIASGREATVHGLYVMDKRIRLAASEESVEDVTDDQRERADDAVADFRELVGDGVDVVTDVVEGIPHKEILAYAEDHGIDLIVIGTHGRTGRDRLTSMGSVTEKVLKESDRPVLVVDIGES